ncbi:virulence RhuM family protein [Moraxella ovis]|uniref:virulence RhuM family protein n=1 Tax=Moraxella ovis TaxID=29433 RepID=UPI000D9006E6|nr:virulence RhuM family protein [Moraxella ovis]SPX81048.1 Virulence protein [Moraxella ovis]STZ05974.1 Virulence protein [Moraxella ovis]
MGDSQIIIFNRDDGAIGINVRVEGDTVWLTQKAMAELFDVNTPAISKHLSNIFNEGELQREATVSKMEMVQAEGARQVARLVDFYNLDAIISVGYRINSAKATQFRIWATQILKEYLIKGFAMDDERLKNVGSGSYFKELLDRIRDIRSSEKVMYRQVLDLYATAIDYQSDSDESILFFKTVQNKLHYAAHGHTASEVIYFRVDSDKPFAGLQNFKGTQPTQAEAMIAKNYLTEQELKVLNNLVSAYFDFAELNAIEEKPMTMQDYIDGLDRLLNATGREVLQGAGNISHAQAETKAKSEYKKYKAKTLSDVEKSYLEVINHLNKTTKKASKK